MNAFQRYGLAAGLAALSMASGWAQDYARVAPKLPEKRQMSELLAPAPAVLPAGSEASLGITLRGLVFLSSAEQLSKTALAAPARGVDTSRMTALDEAHFRAGLARYLGRPLRMRDLAAIRLETIQYLRAHQRPFADVTIPPQNIGTGVIQIVVTEYKLGKVKVAGGKYFSPSLIRQTSGLQPGQMLRLDELENDLDRLNRNPFLTVDAIFEPGAQPSETDIQLNARDQLPLRFYSGYDNLGTRGLGVREFNAGANWGNAFGTGQILSYQFTRSLAGAYVSHSLSDAIPLPWGDQILIFGSYATEHPLLASIFSDHGHSGQASIRYVRPLPRFRHIRQQLEAGYDFKTTDNTLEFAGFHVFGSQAEVDQFPLIYDATIPDRLGETAIQNTLVYSPGNLTPNNSTRALAALVPGARAAYVYDRFMVTRTTPLPKALSAVTRLTLQESQHNLPYSEQVGGGGVGSVRGYYTDTAFGSQGELFSQELRLPSFRPSRWLGRGGESGDKAQFGVFFDYADLRQVTPIPDVKSAVGLASAGFLARYSTSRFFDVEFDTGRRLRSAPTVPVTGWYGQISLTGRF